MYGKPVSELSETEKQTVSTLATVAAGLAGGLVGDSGASAVAGAQSGKTTVENNSMSGLVPLRVQQDASLAFDPSQQGKSAEEISYAIGASHMGPSWGTTYKVHPIVQAGGDVSFIRGYTLNGTIDDNHISVNQGDIYSIGAHGGASLGLSFGPYFPGLINTNNNDYSINGGFGVGSAGITMGKDGVSFTFGVGPSWGWSATEIKGVDVNGTSTNEIYRYDFK
ncbi:TPA: hypothetical protein IBK98_005002 [Escherichia coli]|nr:hypothetical protein [Escherichia coli]